MAFFFTSEIRWDDMDLFRHPKNKGLNFLVESSKSSALKGDTEAYLKAQTKTKTVSNVSAEFFTSENWLVF